MSFLTLIINIIRQIKKLKLNTNNVLPSYIHLVANIHGNKLNSGRKLVINIVTLYLCILFPRKASNLLTIRKCAIENNSASI